MSVKYMKVFLVTNHFILRTQSWHTPHEMFNIAFTVNFMTQLSSLDYYHKQLIRKNCLSMRTVLKYIEEEIRHIISTPRF